MLIPIILYSNEKVTSCISTGISSEKIKPLDTNLEPTMTNLANCKVNLKFSNSDLVQKTFSLFYSNLT